MLSFGQKPEPVLHIQKTEQAITVDGILNETVWQQAEKAKDFFISTPIDTAFAKSKTEVMLTYDDKNLYIAAVCYDEIPGEYIIQSLKRDFSYPRTDAFSVIFNPSNDKTNGFSFAVSPKGIQREGSIENGGDFGVTTA